MSLKAKIEAVIYAAEEPVTLLQLIGLLGQEAQAELDRIASAQGSLALDDALLGSNIPLPAEPDDLNREIFEAAEPDSALDSDTNDSTPEDDLPSPPENASSSEQMSRENAASPEEQGSLNDSPDATAALHEAPSGLSELPSTGHERTPSSVADPKQLAGDEKERARALRDFLRSLLDELIRDYTTSDRGLEIREVAGGFRLATKPEYHDAVRGFVKGLKPPLKLTLQSLETLAVVAYKQPVTAPEISEIRGVDSGGVLGSLMARKLVTTAGRKHVIGRPILYKTTKDFLLRFGLKDINELPSIEEFEKMAGELADNDPIQEEIPMPQHPSAETTHTDPKLSRANQSIEGSITGANLEEEKNATEPQADGDGATIETVTPDGRLSGIAPPQDNANDTNTSATEAEIQRKES